MSSVSYTMLSCSLYVEVTLHQTADGYWGFAHQFPVHAHGQTLQDCTDTLCATLQGLLASGKHAVHRAVLATADATIVVNNPYTAPVYAVELFDPGWPRQRRHVGSSSNLP